MSDARFNRTGARVDWAGYTWNPVTGCKHGCPYCYARDLAEGRFANAFPNGFEPTFHPERLEAPAHEERIAQRKPVPADQRDRICFVCSMADLFGEWVPDEWIKQVLAAEREAPSWTFAHLTKNPARLVSQDWPANAWVGATVDCHARLVPALEALRQTRAKVRFISFEPLRERVALTKDELDAVDWLIIGGQSASSGAAPAQPEWEWVWELTAAAKAADCAVYWKPNLTVRPREWPTC